MSTNITAVDNNDGSFSSGNLGEEVVILHQLDPNHHLKNNVGSSNTSAAADNGSTFQQQQPVKRKRNLPGTPDPNAEVIALSPTTLMATNRFVCEICNKGFQRDQNLQLHRRGHNLPWKLRQRATTDVRKKVYICPEPTCVHHNPARALGDLTGIKKHYSRKHGEKKWKCDKCSKKYAVQSDWKAHQKTCGTREYKCDCGTIFSRRDSFITHRAFCDALVEENNKVNQTLINNLINIPIHTPTSTKDNPIIGTSDFNNLDSQNSLNPLPQDHLNPIIPFKYTNLIGGGMFSTSSGALFGGGVPRGSISPSCTSSLQLSSNNNSSSLGFNYFQDSKNGYQMSGTAHTSATALLQKAAQIGATASNSNINSPMLQTKSYGAHTNNNNNNHNNYKPAFCNNNATSYDDDHQMSRMVGITAGVFNTSSNSNQEMSPVTVFDCNSNNNNRIGIFSNISMDNVSDHHQMKTMETNDDSSGSTSSLMIQGRSPSGVMERVNVLAGSGLSRLGDHHQIGSGGCGGDVETLDFMGIGGSRRFNLPEQQQQQQQRLEVEVMSHQQRIPFTNAPLWDMCDNA